MAYASDGVSFDECIDFLTAEDWTFHLPEEEPYYVRDRTPIEVKVKEHLKRNGLNPTTNVWSYSHSRYDGIQG